LPWHNLRDVGVTSQILVAVLGAVALLGAAMLLVARADHRRQRRRQRLRTLVVVGPGGDDPVLPLRRPIFRRTAREFFLLTTAQARLEAGFAAAGNRIRLPHLMVTTLIATTAVVVIAGKGMRLNPAVVALLGVVTGLAAPALLLRLAQSRYRNQFLDRFPDALDLIGRAVKAGLPVLDATEVAAREIPAPVGSELQRTIEEIRIGVDVDEAMQHTADRIRVPDFRFFVVALKLQRRTGGALAETLANLSHVIRCRKEIRLKARALSSESKSSTVVLALLPFVVGGVMFLINPDLASVLLVDPRGRFMTGLVFLSLAAGVVTMVVIINRTLR
jgi:tight adherence protein B